MLLPRQITGPDKEALFAAARLFALPSLSENFGNVVAEAMIRGLPVVVTAGVGAAEIAEESGGGAIAPGDPKAFAAVVAGLLEVPRAACRYGCSRCCICAGTPELGQHRAPLRRLVHSHAASE